MIILISKNEKLRVYALLGGAENPDSAVLKIVMKWNWICSIGWNSRFEQHAVTVFTFY